MMYILRESRTTTFGTHAISIKGAFNEKEHAEKLLKKLVEKHEAELDREYNYEYEIIEIEQNKECSIDVMYMEWR